MGTTIFVVLYLLAAVLASGLILMAFIRGMKLRAGLPVVPVPTIFPPVPVMPTGGVLLVAALAMAWSAGHLLVIGIWLAKAYLIPHSPPTIIAGLYLTLSAMLVGIGGALLLARRPIGRILISWGMVLLALLTFYALIISFLLPSLEDVPARLREQGKILGVVAALHLAFDTVVGALGRHVGRPAGWSERESDEGPVSPDVLDQTAADWDNLNQGG